MMGARPGETDSRLMSFGMWEYLRGIIWTVKNDCGTPTHQTRQQWTAKDVEKNRVSFKIITQNNKNVIFIGFDGLFDLRRPQKSKKKH